MNTIVNVSTIETMTGVVDGYGVWDIDEVARNIMSYETFLAENDFEDSPENRKVYEIAIDAFTETIRYEYEINGVDSQIAKRSGKTFLLEMV